MASLEDNNRAVSNRALARALFRAVAALAVFLSPAIAAATITQGDFSFFGAVSSAWGARWGEGSARGGTPAPTNGAAPPNTLVTGAGSPPGSTGGSFDFNHWDLIEARQGLDLTTDDHLVKGYQLLGRLDTLILPDARLYANYTGWYDAFPDLKHRGRAETARDWGSFSSQDRIDEFTRDELKEYYAQLNFSDNFSMRIGKQQVIWSEADAFSGTEVTNPVDYRFGNIASDSTDSNSRVNLRMIKFDYILPDYLRTANNLFEFFVIPGDFEGALKAQLTDARNPWIPPVPISVTLYNQDGQPFQEKTLMDQGATPLFRLPSTKALKTLSNLVHTKDFFADLDVITSQNEMNDRLANSEFGARYSTLIPIGGGLQTSFIWLYEARSNKLGLCQNCTQPAPFKRFSPGIFLAVSPQNFNIKGFGTSAYDFGPPRIKNNLGTIRLLLRNEYVRQSFFGLTGTYYEKELSDMVYRYDFLYAPKIAAGSAGTGFGNLSSGSLIGGQQKWGEQSRWIIAADRPTYIPWISKQHTFLVAQYTATWNPAPPPGTRSVESFFFLAANNWLRDGRLTTLNVWAWEPDDTVGFVSSSNSYRYSANVLFSIDAIWYLGRSGLSSGLGGILSRAQRINEVSVSFNYEI